MNPIALTEVFYTVAALSWRASWLIALLLVLRVAVRGRLPAQVWFAGWILVALRLLLPFSVPTGWSPFNFLTPQPPVVATTDLPRPPAVAVTARELSPAEAISSAVVVVVDPTVNKPARSLVEVMGSVWIGGVILFGLVRLAGWWNVRRQLRGARPVADERVRELVKQEALQMGGSASVAMVETEVVDAPALCGFVRPQLLLPPGLAERLSDDELRHVVRHELGHWRRRDLVAQALMQAAVVLHWFNPLVWLAARVARADCELACDEFVLRREPADGTTAYGATLLKVLGATRGRRRPFAVVGMLEGKEQLTHRIRMIAGYRRSRIGGVIAGVGLVAILATVSLTRESRGEDNTGIEEKRLVAVPPMVEVQGAKNNGVTKGGGSTGSRGTVMGNGTVTITAGALKISGGAASTPTTMNGQTIGVEMSRSGTGTLLLSSQSRGNTSAIGGLKESAGEAVTLANGAGPMETMVFPVRRASARVVLRSIASLLEQTQGRAAVDDRTNSLVVTGRPATMAGIRQVVDQLDEAAGEVDREFSVSVVGAVNKQTAAEFSGKAKPIVLDAIARAGGFAPNADRSAVQLIRMNPDGKRTTQVMTKEMLMTGAGPDDLVRLRRGDIVVVPEMPEPGFFVVMGAVGAPGSYPLVGANGNQKVTLIEGIAKAGGFSRIASKNRVTLRRVDPQTQATKVIVIDVSKILQGTADSADANVTLQPGDVISVSEVFM